MWSWDPAFSLGALPKAITSSWSKPLHRHMLMRSNKTHKWMELSNFLTIQIVHRTWHFQVALCMTIKLAVLSTGQHPLMPAGTSVIQILELPCLPLAHTKDLRQMNRTGTFMLVLVWLFHYEHSLFYEKYNFNRKFHSVCCFILLQLHVITERPRFDSSSSCADTFVRFTWAVFQCSQKFKIRFVDLILPLQF